MTYIYEDNYWELNGNNAQVDNYRLKTQEFIDYCKLNTSSKTLNYKLMHPIYLQEYDELLTISQDINNKFNNILIIGIGGSILNPKMVASLKHEKLNNIFFLDSPDPIYYHSLIDNIDKKDTCVLVISKSGNTIETMALLGAVLNDKEIPHSNFYFIVGEGDNYLRNIAKKMRAKTLTHDNKLGGRFATFSNVGILTGMLLGLDMISFIDGANGVIEEFWYKKESSSSAKAAVSLCAFGKNIMVNLGYSKLLSSYLNWYSQIIAESLGKDGKGYTPLRNICPPDQHSLFQLYLDGPRDKIYSFINIKSYESVTKIKGIKKLKGFDLGDINNIEYQATLKTCKEHKLPVRNITLSAFNEYNLGALAMHTILETIVLANLIDVNPFGQPAVESIKNNINQLLNI